MQFSFESIHKKLVAAIPIGKPKTHCTKLHLAILQHYVKFLRKMSEEEVPEIFMSESADLTEELKKYVFRVPTQLKEVPDDISIINKYRPVREFITFLVRFLYHKPAGSIVDSCGDQIKNLEKELRFLLIVLGDTTLLACAQDQEHQELKNVLAEFEGVANEAGSLVHSLFFLRSDGAFREMGDRIAVVLNRLKGNIIKLSDCVTTSAYMPRNTSVVESLLVLDLLVRDLEDLKKRADDDNSIDDDAKDQIQTLHQSLLCFQSFIKDTGSPQDELKEFYMRIGDLAHQAQYLIISFLTGDAPLWYLVNRLIHVNHKIELCRIELPQISMKCNSGVAKYINKQPKRNSDVDGDIVGFEGKMRYMLDHLVGGGAERRVIAIFGMPGLGKTTLAKKLYNHPLVTERFDRLSWCDVSQSYSTPSILAKILIDIASELGKDKILKMEEQSLVENIHKTLKGRRYLIVIDDVWDSNVCDELFTCFPDDENSSRILFTTRNRYVAPPNCIMYALPLLSHGQCWELIQKKVFNNQACPPQLVQSGRALAASCHGMPLAAVVIAGVLSTVDKEESAWEEVRTNLSTYINVDGGDNSVMQILKLSYDHLPQQLKLCFLYLGVFSVRRRIRVQDMMNLWIAEGFIDHNKNERNAAEEYLKELIDRSLVMVVKRKSAGGPKRCYVHDLLRELCFKTCAEEKLTRFVNSSKYLENEEDRLKVDMNSTYMRNWFGRRMRTNSYQIEVPDMRLLRVLHIGCSFTYLTGIEYLVCLKYLVVDAMPPSIGNLVNLEYLHVGKSVVYLSSTIMKMKKLKYVKAATGVIYCKDCDSFLTNKLEFLSNVKVKDEKMFKCSPLLRRLCCFYVKRVHGIIDLSFLTRLQSLTLQLTGGGARMIMSLPSSIKKLTLHGYMNKLYQKTLSMIGRLENLEVLKLLFMYFEGNRWDTRDGEFQKLKHLRLHNIGFTRWNVGSSQHFPKLRQLDLTMCHQLGEIPAEIGGSPMLQKIGVDWWLKKSATRIQQQQREMGNEDLKLGRPRYVWYSTAEYPRALCLFVITSLLSVYLSAAALCSNWKSDPIDVVDD